MPTYINLVCIFIGINEYSLVAELLLNKEKHEQDNLLSTLKYELLFSRLYKIYNLSTESNLANSVLCKWVYIITTVSSFYFMPKLMDNHL